MRADDCVPFRLPRDAVVPDYGEGGLFGLVSAIRGFLDGECWSGAGASVHHREGGTPGPGVLVFILVDGLGDGFLQRFGQGSCLLANRRRRITSVFPSTTASAVTTVLTGIAPAEHGLTGWYIRDRRFGGVLAPLPMTLRAGGPVGGLLAAQRLFPYGTLFERRRRASIMVSPRHIAWSAFSRRHCRGARLCAYEGLAGMVEAVDAAVAALSATGGGYVHAYYPDFDRLSHEFGAASDAVVTEFWRIDAALGRLAGRLAARGAEMLVSADHGFIDSPDARQVRLADHPDAAAMLNGPLFGERRVAFAELRDGAEAEFAAFVREALSGKAVLVRSAELLERGFFGSGPRHRRLAERIGTHALLMEPGWTIWDQLAGEHVPAMIGVHGGLTPEEMWIPLIRMRC